MPRHLTIQDGIYDANGNRLTKTLGGTTETYTVDDADKLTSISVGGSTTKSYGYDAAGRTTSVTTGAGTTTLAYDYEGRITTITYPTSSTNTFTYNGLDTRVGTVDSTGTKTYKRDGAYVTDPVLSDSAASYTPGISERRSSTTKFYHTDRLGTTERLTNTSQTTTDTREYDAFGLLTSSSGSTPTPFGFAGAWGYQEDPDSGLKLLGHRYYDPSSGRFLSADTAMHGRNWYNYCEANPSYFLDPVGMEPLPFWRIAWHALDQMIEREGHGVSNKAILDAVRNGVKSVSKYDPACDVYIARLAKVVVDRKKGKLVTVVARSSKGFRIPGLLAVDVGILMGDLVGSHWSGEVERHRKRKLERWDKIYRELDDGS